MSSLNFVRLCGLAAFIGGVLLPMASLLPLVPVADKHLEYLPLAQVAASAGELLGSVLVLLGLFGLYTRQSEPSGALGLVGFLAAFLGTALHLVLVGGESAPMWLILVGFSTFVLGFLGWLLFGVATLRARVYPRTAAWLLLIGIIGTGSTMLVPGLGVIPGFMFVQVGFNVLFAAAVAWLGFVVFAREGEKPMHRILYGGLLAIVGLSPEADDESDGEGTEPNTASGA